MSLSQIYQNLCYNVMHNVDSVNPVRFQDFLMQGHRNVPHLISVPVCVSDQLERFDLI